MQKVGWLSLVLGGLATACAGEPGGGVGEHATEAELPPGPDVLGAPQTMARLIREDAAWVTRPSSPPARSLRKVARVHLPREAGRPFRVEDAGSGATILVTLRDVPVAGWREVGPAGVVARDAEGRPRVVYRATDEGLEDWVRVDDAAAVPALRFDVELHGVAGLRLVADTLEMLDDHGTPRLRAAPPYVVDAAGQRRAASLDVEGCAVDRSPAAPWGRAVTPPGQGSCPVVVRWEAAGLAYPVWVDPYWTTTGSMTYGRARFPAARLLDGTVFVAGGYGKTGWMDASERFHPPTGTWAAAGTMPHGVLEVDAVEAVVPTGPMVVLGDGRALVTGGTGAAVANTTLVYDPADGTWEQLGAFVTPRRRHSLSPLPDGRALMVGGYDDAHGWLASTELFDPESGTWSEGKKTLVPHAEHQAIGLPDGRVAVVGGLGGFGMGPMLMCEVYTPDAGIGSWAGMASLQTKAVDAHLAVLPDDGLLFVGGAATNGGGTITQRWLPSNEWLSPPPLPVNLMEVPALATVGGLVVLAGGQDPKTFVEVNQVAGYDPTTDAWSALDSLLEGRAAHAVIALAEGQAMVIGGEGASGWRQSAEILRESLGPGAPCTTGFECSGGVCVGGVCCDRACDDPCEACTAADKVAGESGVCGPARACEQGCDSSADCAEGLLCSAEATCVPPASAAGEPSCAIGVERGADPWPSLLATALAAVGTAARRRRRRPSR